MKFIDGWWWPDCETHMPEWMAEPANRYVLNGRPAYQGRKQAKLLELMQTRPARVAVDVGAHVGTWSWNLAHMFEVVHAFEPVVEHRACFAINVLEQFGGQVVLHDCALGARPGKVKAMPDPGNPKHSTGGTYMALGGDLPMRTLDSFELADVDLIKIDVEGLELEVLRGGIGTLMRCRPVVVIEQKGRDASNFGRPKFEALDYLREAGMIELAPPMAGDFFMGWK